MIFVYIHFGLPDIAPPIKACQKDEGREEIYQGRKPQEYSCIARLSDAEKFSIWQVLLAMFSWGSNNIAARCVPILAVAFRQHRTKTAWMLCTSSACWFSVIVHKASLPYAGVSPNLRRQFFIKSLTTVFHQIFDLTWKTSMFRAALVEENSKEMAIAK